MTFHKETTSSNLRFLSNEASEAEGLGHSGIETYRDAPYASTARETGQNSNDAKENVPVRVSFDLLSVPKNDLPCFDKLKQTIDLCAAEAKARGQEREIDFFIRAKAALNSDEIRVLRISDTNTTGLVGPSVSGTPFHSLLKGSGISVKEAEDSGGSFGIGKNAPYAVSDLRTVYYSTLYKERKSDQLRFLAQGKSILVSHTDADGVARKGIGYWGRNFEPIGESTAVPHWLQRDEVGTSVFVIGFPKGDAWVQRIAYSVLINFFAAIHNGDMEFTIGNGALPINTHSLPTVFQHQEIREAANENDKGYDLWLAGKFYECLTSNDAIESRFKIEGLGEISIRILIGEDLPKKVCILRNGMVITDTLKEFGEALAKFPMYQNFVAVVQPHDVEGRALIQSLENPRHDGLSAERLSDDEKRVFAKRAMKALGAKIRETIKQYAVMRHGSETLVDEMAKYFAVADNQEPTQQSDEDDPEALRYTPQTKLKQKVIRAGAPLGKHGGQTGKRNGRHKKKRRRGSVGVTGNARPVELENLRNLLVDDASLEKRRILFTPAESGQAIIEIEAVGMDRNEELQVVAAKGADLSGGRLLAQFVAGERFEATVQFGNSYAGPIEVRAALGQTQE